MMKITNESNIIERCSLDTLIEGEYFIYSPGEMFPCIFINAFSEEEGFRIKVFSIKKGCTLMLFGNELVTKITANEFRYEID